MGANSRLGTYSNKSGCSPRKHNVSYYSAPIRTNRLIFSKWIFFIVFFLDMSTNSIISEIQFLWSTSSLLIFIKQHFFSTLKMESFCAADIKQLTKKGCKTIHQVACEQQTHFRWSLLSLRKIAIVQRERSDDRKCVYCSQAIHQVTSTI